MIFSYLQDFVKVGTSLFLISGYAYNLGLAYGLGNIVNDERLSKLTLRLESGRFYPITEDVNNQYYTHTTFGLTYKLK